MLIVTSISATMVRMVIIRITTKAMSTTAGTAVNPAVEAMILMTERFWAGVHPSYCIRHSFCGRTCSAWRYTLWIAFASLWDFRPMVQVILWEFPIIRGTLFWGPYNKDPTS